MIALITLLVLMVLETCSGVCPLWTISGINDTCQCGSDLGGLVSCESSTHHVAVLFCHCMTYNEHINETVVGFCLTTCRSRNETKCNLLNEIHTNNMQQINQETCGLEKRTGQNCGNCIEGYGYPVYSYVMQCANCSETDFKYNLFKYTAVTFLPLTVFYFFVIVFKISINSGNMVGYILVCQLASVPTLSRAIIAPESKRGIGTLFLYSCFAIWNLDVFRSLYTPFCIHPKMNALHVLALDYLIGTYPLFLIFLTYVAVVLHDRYPIIVKIWSPVYKLLMCIRREWNIRGSLIQAFTTFLVLSYVKILNVSFDLLLPVTLKTAEGKTLNKTYLFNAGEIEYFGREHLPFGILAVIMLAVFTILPLLLLLLYPCHCFQKCLNCCGSKSHILIPFMDAFQGSYRHRPRDCRYFSALYLLVRIVYLITFALVRASIFLTIVGVYYIVLAAIIVFAEPYANKTHNRIDIFFLLLHGLVFLVGNLNTYLKEKQPPNIVHYLFFIFAFSGVAITVLYGVVVVILKVLPNKLVLSIKYIFSKRQSEETLPHQFEHEDETSHMLQSPHY